MASETFNGCCVVPPEVVPVGWLPPITPNKDVIWPHIPQRATQAYDRKGTTPRVRPQGHNTKGTTPRVRPQGYNPKGTSRNPRRQTSLTSCWVSLFSCVCFPYRNLSNAALVDMYPCDLPAYGQGLNCYQYYGPTYLA